MFENKISHGAESRERNVSVTITPVNEVFIYRRITKTVVLTSTSRQSSKDNISAITGMKCGGVERVYTVRREEIRIGFLSALRSRGMRANPVWGIAVGRAH